MKKIYSRVWLKFAFLAILVGLSTVTYTNSGGPSAGLTGAPSEGNCTNCHAGTAVTSGSAFDAISLTGLPSGGYAPGTNYSLTMNANSAATAKNGFQLIALSPSNAMAGSFTSGTGSQAMVGGGGKTYLGHTLSGNSQTSWTYNWTAPNPGVGTVTFYVALNATNSNSGTGGDVVYLKTFTVSGGNLPVATITSPATPAVFCAGDSIQFTGTATNTPISYAWDFLGNSPATSNLQNPKIKFNNAGFYTIRFRATNTSGTSTNAQLTLQVVAKPMAAITPAINQTICGGDSVTLIANTGTNLSYLWSPGNQTTQTIKVGAAGLYSVRVSSAAANCFTNSSAVTMSVSPKPTLSATLSSNTLCIGDSIEIVATPGLQNYKYYFGSALIDSSANSTRRFAVTSSFTNIFIKGSNGTCSSDPVVKAVTISSKSNAPSIACGLSTPSSITFTISGNNPQISLDSGKTYFDPSQGNTHVINGLNPNTQITAFARNATGAPCLFSLLSNKTCISINCTPLTLSVTAPRYVCSNSLPKDKMIRVVSTNAVNPYYKYTNVTLNLSTVWLKRDTFDIITNSGDFQYRVLVMDSANASCSVKDTSFFVSVVNLNWLNAKLNSDKSEYCKNDLISFSFNNIGSIINKVKYYYVVGSNRTEFASRIKPDFGYGPVNIDPSFPNGTVVGAQTLDSISGCGVFTNNVTLNISELPKIGFTFSKTNLQIALIDTTSNTVRRNWYIESDTFPTNNKVFNHVFISAGAKVIRMEAFTSTNCSASISIPINIVASGLQESANLMGVQLYPNPASTELTLTWNNGGKADIELFDVQAKLVLSTQLESGNKLNISELGSGVYLLKVSSNNQYTYRKLIVD